MEQAGYAGGLQMSLNNLGGQSYLLMLLRLEDS